MNAHDLDDAGRCTRCGVEWRADHDDAAYGEYYDAAGTAIGYDPGPCDAHGTIRAAWGRPVSGEALCHECRERSSVTSRYLSSFGSAPVERWVCGRCAARIDQERDGQTEKVVGRHLIRVGAPDRIVAEAIESALTSTEPAMTADEFRAWLEDNPEES